MMLQQRQCNVSLINQKTCRMQKVTLAACLQVTDGKPAALELEPGEEEVSLLAGHMRDDVAAVNAQPLQLGLLKARAGRQGPVSFRYPLIDKSEGATAVLHKRTFSGCLIVRRPALVSPVAWLTMHKTTPTIVPLSFAAH